MNIQYKTRNLYPDELRILNKLKSQKEKEKMSKIKLHHFVTATILGTVLIYISSKIPDSFWLFLSGTTAVLLFAFVFFTPFEIYKKRKRHKSFLQQLNTIIAKGTVDTYLVMAKEIAIAPEYDDESDLYIIEINENEVLYLWDTEYNLNKKFPCLNFEIYDDVFFKLTNRQIYQLSEKIQPRKIDKKAKLNFIKQNGAPKHLEIEKINLAELFEKYNNYI